MQIAIKSEPNRIEGIEFKIYNLIPFTCDDGLLQFIPNSATITKMNKDWNDKKEPYKKEGLTNSITKFLKDEIKKDKDNCPSYD